jgi:hypothetical protein
MICEVRNQSILREKSMLKQILGATALVSIAVTTGCAKPYVADLYSDFSGEWTLKWLKNDSLHPVSLAQDGKVLTGIYTNSEDVSCSISGKYKDTSKIKLLIDCPDWDIKLYGVGSQKDTAIGGHYIQEIGFFKKLFKPANKGDFVMLKNKQAPVAAAAAEKKGS